MRNFNTNTKNDTTWLTPPWLINALGAFDIDPCCPPQMPWATAKRMISLPEDGLAAPWQGRVWLNPPYGRIAFDWLKKLSNHCKSGGSGLALVFARTETEGFQSAVWGKAKFVYFFKGRLKFCYEDGKEGNAANAPSCLVAYTIEEFGYLKAVQHINHGTLVHL